MITRRKFLATALLGTGVVAADALGFEKFFIETNQFYFGRATTKTDNLKVVQVSDLHLQTVNYQLKQLAARLNKMQPHLILITGDAIDKAENIPLLDSFLSLIDRDLQKAAILGNWERWAEVNLRELEKTYKDHNCTLLINQTKQFSFQGKTISVTGVDDFIGGIADIDTALSTYQPGDYHVILNHCPQYSDTIAERLPDTVKTDFILSGHTHGGQLNFFGYAPFLPRGSGKYMKGWYDVGVRKMYVSKGIGTSIFPARFGSRAEIAVFNFEA